MTLIVYKIFTALLIFLTSMITMIYPLKSKGKIKQARSFELGEALASGIFLGVAFFHLLPSSIAIFAKLYPQISYPLPEVICIVGFLLLVCLERLFSAQYAEPTQTVPSVLAVILVVHALTEGTTLGIGNMTEAIIIFIAIITHKSSESFALCITLMRYEISYKQILFMVTFFSFMTPLGISLGTLIHLFAHSINGELITAIFSAFAAGTFLYITMIHQVQFHHRLEEERGFKTFISMLLGILLMGLIAIWA